MSRSVKALVVGLAGIMLLVGGLATASNMGFKFVPNVPAGKAFNLSVPWNHNYPATANADDIFNDGVAMDSDLANIQKFTNNSKLVTWSTGSLPPAPTIAKGEAAIVNAKATGAIQGWVIVGSHDPNFQYTFPDKAFNAAAPYHQTFTKAHQLFNDLKTQFPAVQNIQKFNENSKLLTWSTGSLPPAFDLTLGMGVIVNTSGGAGPYTWPHY